MKRTTISLPDELAGAVEREAARRRVSVSQVVREAIEQRLGWDSDQPIDLPFIGIGASGETDIGERFDEMLAAEWPDAILDDR